MQRELERVRDIAEGWFLLSDQARAKHRAEFNRQSYKPPVGRVKLE
jgi:hypothetical protein